MLSDQISFQKSNLYNSNNYKIKLSPKFLSNSTKKNAINTFSIISNKNQKLQINILVKNEKFFPNFYQFLNSTA